MPARSFRPPQVRIEVEEDRARDVRSLVCRTTGARLAEHPADVRHDEVGRPKSVAELLGRNERRRSGAGGHGTASMPHWSAGITLAILDACALAVEGGA